jgi:hypothetical protein
MRVSENPTLLGFSVNEGLAPPPKDAQFFVKRLGRTVQRSGAPGIVTAVLNRKGRA